MSVVGGVIGERGERSRARFRLWGGGVGAMMGVVGEGVGGEAGGSLLTDTGVPLPMSLLIASGLAVVEVAIIGAVDEVGGVFSVILELLSVMLDDAAVVSSSPLCSVSWSEAPPVDSLLATSGAWTAALELFGWLSEVPRSTVARLG